MGHFTYATTLDLSIGYYYLELDNETADLCSVSLPFSTFCYRYLPQGAIPAVNYFQREISHLFADLDFVKVYLDDILIHSYSDAIDYLNKLIIILNRLREYGLKVKVSKCKFLQKKVLYLGYNISDQGASP